MPASAAFDWRPIVRKATPRDVRQGAGRLVLGLGLALGLAKSAPGDEPAQSHLRHTPLVKMLEQTVPATVLLHTPDRKAADGTVHFKTGAGSIIHRDGFVLTAAHVLNLNPQGFILRHTGQPLQYRKVAEVAAYDLAVVRIVQTDEYPVLPLGRSHDLMLGEPVVAIGNPRSYGLTVTEGIISGLERSARSGDVSIRDMLQTSAPLNPGNSGGPLINAEGRQIGIAVRGDERGESFGLAVAADRVRQVLPRVLAPGPRAGIEAGFAVDLLIDPPTISAIADDGPASKLDLQIGDTITALDGRPLPFSYSLLLEWVDAAADETFELTVERADATHTVELTLGSHRSPQPVSEHGSLRTGLRYSTYEFPAEAGVASLDEAFGAGKLASSGVINGVDVDAIRPRPENFAIRYEGLLKIPTAGLYTLSITSDDGSRMYLDDRLLIDNDGSHPSLTEAAVVRLHAGSYPVRIEYFQGRGAADFSVTGHRDGFPQEPIPDAAFAHEVPSAEAAE
ncbi:trypsin-like peptidase domain-containing protein [Candidatus Laterigemmans baculatus]|uniref:trypsin-like peptidase domain-containing protein n=1 Tax=Candidatus Laterigemmans baculatus TaxID=2770505 RepID=UPI0013DC86C4|nr:trypsin-like peptidase domain-containing protein [Candidatus Laterigemmans baculatus]